MVQTRSKKSVKYTYAERVLGAYSKAQKERRKSSVHIATLRANVRKMADSRKEKLGPQWTNWVGRAVHKLEDQGILKPVDCNGHVSMTEEGQKALTAARRKVFGTSTNQEHTQDEEEFLWRSVTDQFVPATHISGAHGRLSVASVARRKRRQSVRVRSATEEEGEPSASTHATPKAKKRRVTGAEVAARTPHKPLSKMNKAELKEELRALKSRVIASQTTTPQATQQIPELETQSLLQKLQDARAELAAFRLQSGLIFGEPDEGLTDLEDQEVASGDVERATSPGATVITPRPIRIRPAQHRVLGVMRTESGSPIPGVSGRPTPAPSKGEPVWNWGDVAPDMGDHGDMFIDDRADRGDTGTSGQVISPALMPPCQDHASGEVLRDKIQASLNAGLREVMYLRTELAHKARAVASLAEKETAIRELQSVLAAKDEEITILQTAILAKDSTIADRDSTLAENDVLLSTIRDALAQKEASIAGLQSVLQQAVAEKDRTLQETIVSKDIIITAKTDSVNELQASLSEARAEATQLAVRIRTVEQALEASQDGLERQRGDIERLLDTIKEKDAEMAESILAKNAVIEQTNARFDAVNLDMIRVRKTALDLSARFTATQTQATETEGSLRSSLEAVRAENQMLTKSILALQSEKAVLEGQIEEFRGRVIELTRDLRTSSMEHAAGKSTIIGLLGMVDELSGSRDEEARMSAAANEALGVLEAEARQLRDQVHDAEMEIQQCRGELAKEHVALVTEQTSASMLRSELTVMRTNLSTAQSTLEIAKKEVLDAKNELSAADNEVQALRAAKKVDELTIKELKGVYERWRNAQGEWMNELDNKITLVQASISTATA
ncbi:hypothetical protein PAXRUDRAFT_835432 [Paxillus rubicundulus Ve08.2h10]|uniref:Uncharacterized protein n=1 Tax=Paxillus rubicundulus Ve08.2h10 TaxID=930991 RepID=A0A0D0D7E6_9AGAM|nr:hypothetical protein PAXRUDRAFT_835432 [Paxillus rubicundulus Ve08.2h10]